MYIHILFIALLGFSFTTAQSPCSQDQFESIKTLVEIAKKFPQNESSLYIGVSIIRAFPSGLAGDTTQFQQAFDAIALMFSEIFNVTLHVQNVEDVRIEQFYTFCTVYNSLSSTPLAPFIRYDNLAALLTFVRYGVLNALTPQPSAANFTNEYFLNNAPGAVKLALVPSGMVVSWQTLANYTSSKNSGKPQVRFGLSKNRMNQITSGDSHTYGTVYFHDVILKPLKSSTFYYYQIVGDKTNTIYNFTSAPRNGSKKPFVATILGDMGYINAEETYDSMKRLVQQSATDLFIHIGDISYADNYFLRPAFAEIDTYEESWNVWQQWMSPISSNVPYMVLPGNHEAACQLFLSYMVCPRYQQNFTAYRHRFRMPSEESGAGKVENMWSSFDYGLVHFVMIDTETDYPNSTEGPNTQTASGPFGGNGKIKSQLEWLENDLKKANRNRRNIPWIVVMGHRPIYTAIVNDGTTSLDGFHPAVPLAFESLMAKYNVDIYFAGHLHFYERLFPIKNGIPQRYEGNKYLNPTAPTYIINGAAGNDEHLEDVKYNYTLGSYYNNIDYGFGQLHVHNYTHLQWTYVLSSSSPSHSQPRYSSSSFSPSYPSSIHVDDEVWIIKEKNRPSPHHSFPYWN